jgi:hypothetical protein
MHRFVKTTEIALAYCALLAFALSWVMSFWAYETMPTHPDTVHHLLMPMLVNGRTVYISGHYHVVSNFLFWGSMALLLGAVLIDFYADPFHRRGGAARGRQRSGAAKKHNAR